MTSHGELPPATRRGTGFHGIIKQDSRNDGKKNGVYFKFGVKFGTRPGQAFPKSIKLAAGDSDGATTSTPARATDRTVGGVTTSTPTQATDGAVGGVTTSNPARDTDGTVGGVTTSTPARASDGAVEGVTKGTPARAIDGTAVGGSDGPPALTKGQGRKVPLRSYAQKRRVKPEGGQLMHAGINGHLDKVKALYAAGVNLIARDDFGRTCLHHAAGHGHTDIVQYLIEHADPMIVNMKDTISGRTALHDAADTLRHDICKLLLVAQADKTIKDSKGETPLQIALKKTDNRALVEIINGTRPTFKSVAQNILRKKRAEKRLQRKEGVINASIRGDLDKIRALHDSGVTLFFLDEVGRTFLHNAARFGDIEVAKYLIEQEGSTIVEMKDRLTGQTALHEAASQQRHDICELLLAANADVRAEDWKGNTPMLLALKADDRVLAERLKDGINYLPSDDKQDTNNNVLVRTESDDFNSSDLTCRKNQSFISDGDVKSRAKVPRLHQAAREGDVLSIKHILDSVQQGNGGKKGEKRCRAKIRLMVNGKDELGLTALHYAAHCYHLRAVELLLDNGADPSAVDKKKRTPLHLAVCNQQIKLREARNGKNTFEPGVIECLMQRGPLNDEVFDYLWRTPLEVAAQHGNVQAIKAIFQKLGVQYDKPTESSYDQNVMHQALVTALKYNRSEVSRWLFSKISYHHDKIKPGTLLLHSACLGGKPEMVQRLFHSVERAGDHREENLTQLRQMLGEEDQNKSIPLHIAVEKGNLFIAKMCLKRGSEVNKGTRYNTTPLHLAAMRGNLELVKLLITYEADVDARELGQRTPLHKAAMHNRTSVAEYLLANGANIECRDEEDFTPLLIATRFGHVSMMKVLLAHGAEVVVTDLEGRTPVFWAVRANRVEALKLLVKYIKNKKKKKADVMYMLDARNLEKNSPLHVAAARGFLEVLKCLLEQGTDLDSTNDKGHSALHSAAKHGQIQIMEEILSEHNESRVSAKDHMLNSVLHIAALYGQLHAVNFLLERGADLETRNVDSATPLHFAAERGHAEVCRALLLAHAQIDPRDDKEMTPYHRACAEGHTDAVKILLEFNTPIKKKNKDGDTGLDLAIISGHRDVAIAIINSARGLDALRTASEQSTANKTPFLTKLFRHVRSSNYRRTPMRLLIEKMPDVAVIALNRCIKLNKPTEYEKRNADPFDKITVDFELLDDTYSSHWDEDSVDLEEDVAADDNLEAAQSRAVPYHPDKYYVRNNHPLIWIAQRESEELLTHPVVKLLLEKKWRLGSLMFALTIFFHFVFLVALSYFVLKTPAPFSYVEERRLFLNSTMNASFCRFLQLELGVQQAQGVEEAKRIVWAFGLMTTIREAWVLRMSSLKKGRNVITWLKLISALIVTIDISHCHLVTGFKTDWQWQAGAVAIFMTYIEMLLRLTEHPHFGIQVIMFTDVLCSFLKFFLFFGLLIVTFAITFTVLLQNQYPFRHMGLSMVKMVVMMIGELEFETVFHSMEDPSNLHMAKPRERLYYDVITYLLFISFCILMCIITMNLLVGLAVGNIEHIQEQASIKTAAMRAELAVNMEVIPYIKLLVRGHIHRQDYTAKNGLFSGSITKAKIKDVLTPKHTEVETHTKALSCRLERMENTLANISSTLNPRLAEVEAHTQGLGGQLQRVESMLTAVLSAHNINWQPEDAQQ